jgi:predicted metal-dependent enzyme (double-stranded beta helix superfamily)
MLVDALPLSQTLETLKKLIANAIDSSEKMTATCIKGFVEQAQVKLEDLAPYADFDHPDEDGYGRKMIYDGGNFEIMAMSWNPGDYSSIHNHGYTEWGVVQTFGNAHHFIYHIKDGELCFAIKEILVKGAITKVVNATIHQMGNPSTRKFMTLHIYGSTEKDGDITGDAKNYELEFNRVNHTTGGAFMNLPEDLIYDFEACPRPSDDVFINYAKLLMDNYHRQEQTPKIKALKANLMQKLQERIC